MFLPAAHVETRVPVLRQLMRDHPLGVLTTAIPGTGHPLILCSHIPWVLDVDDEASETELGRLRGHLARDNPQSRAMMTAAAAATAGPGPGSVLEHQVLVLFTAAPPHYVTPQFYVETKPATAKVVPTWNYAAVQVYGKATLYCDAGCDATARFLARQIDDLSRHAETSVMQYTGAGDRPAPWSVADAPPRYIERMTRGIIGVEIAIERLEGKFKMSQEKRAGDRMGVVRGFEALGSDAGRAMAAAVRERGDAKEAAARA